MLLTLGPVIYVRRMHLEHTVVIVDDCDSAISFYERALGFELVDFDSTYRRMLDHGVEFLDEPRTRGCSPDAIVAEILAGTKRVARSIGSCGTVAA